MRHRLLSVLVGFAVSMGIAGDGVAALTLTDLNIFQDNRSENDVSATQGDLFQFGADITGGSAGGTIAAIFTPNGSTIPSLVQGPSLCGPLSTNPSFCSRTSPFTPTGLAGTWQVSVRQLGTTVVATLPSTAPIPAQAIAFPTNVTISANGTTPTISWTPPPNTTQNAFRINIYDRSTPVIPGTTQHDVIDSANLLPNAVSYTPPALLSSSKPGNPVSLIPGDKYTIELQVIETRDGGPLPAANNINANILTRSSSFFDFSPPTTGSPPVIALPMVSGTTGVYQFQIGSVGPNTVTFIDPAIAIGYDYAIGVGDPNFASVILPDVGGGKFTLSYLGLSKELDAGTQFFFPTGGVSAFDVTGIDPSADLDPANTLAFVTGLTFVSNGQFNGTMTPLTTNVTAPEPGAVAILTTGMVLLGYLRRHRRMHH